MQDATGKLSQDYQQLVKDVAILKTDLGALLTEAKSQAKDRVDAKKDTVVEAFVRNADRVQSQADELASSTKKTYEEKPWIFLIAAFFAGVLIRSFMSSK